MTSWRQRVSSLLDSESSPTPSPKGPQYKSGPYEYVSPEPSTPYSNSTGFWVVVIGANLAGVAFFRVVNGGKVVDFQGFTEATLGVQPTMTAGSGTGTTDNQNGQVYTFAGFAVGGYVFAKPFLVPPGAVVTSSPSGIGLQVILCDTLKDALSLIP